MVGQLAVDYIYNNSPVSTPSVGYAGFLMVMWLIALAIIVVMIIAMWKVFVKAGQPGWAAIVPLYNTWVLAEVAGKPGWWGLYPLIAWVPFLGWIVSVILSIMISLGVARNFRQSDVFGIFGLWLFAPIGFLILGFGDATYQPKTDQPNPPAQTPAQLPN